MKDFYCLKFFSILTAGMMIACGDNSNKISGPSSTNDYISEQETDIAPDTQIPNTQIKDSAINSGAKKDTTSERATISARRSAEAHTHGNAELAIVLENEAIIIEFDSPLYNILGFEHRPETEAQKRRVMSAETQLSQADGLFVFNSEAACRPSSQIENIQLFENQKSPSSADHDHSHDEDHSHDHKDEGDENNTHKDMRLTYRFSCDNSSAIKNVSVNLFEAFENLSDVDVVYLGPSTQKQLTLNRNNSEMDLLP